MFLVNIFGSGLDIWEQEHVRCHMSQHLRGSFTIYINRIGWGDYR